MHAWSLPGPLDFVERLAEAARKEGILALLAPPHVPRDLDAALETALSSTHDRLVRVPASGDDPPLTALSMGFGLDLRSASVLRGEPGAEGVAVLLGGLDAAVETRWDAVLRAFAAGCAAPSSRYAPVIIAVADPATRPALQAARIPVWQWRGAVGRTDATRVALDALGRGRDPLLDRLAIETAVALGGWDLPRVACEAARRSRSLEALLAIPEASGKNRHAGWETGLEDLFDGRPFRASSDASKEELVHRVWRAQVTVLFGWLEELRLSFIERVGLLGQSSAWRDSEWAQLACSLREERGKREEARLAEECRRLRNRLAHREPVLTSEFASVLHRARQLDLWPRA